MKWVNWPCTAGILTRVLGILALTTAATIAVPGVGTSANGGDNTLGLLINRLALDLDDRAHTLPENSLDYILGDSVFGALMFASANHAEVTRPGGHWRGQITTTPVTLPC